MKIWKIILVSMMFVSLMVGISLAGESRRRQRRLPEHEVHTHDRFIKYERSGGNRGDGIIHFINKTTIRRKYRDSNRSKRRACVDEKGRSVQCR